MQRCATCRRLPPKSLICSVDVAPVRAEPDDEAEQVTQLLRDEPVEVEEIRDAWCRIRTAYAYPGWIRKDALVDGTGTLAGASPCRDPLEGARTYIGAPYEWGGMTERGIDCSGLVHMAYRRAGRLVPRDADQQEAAASAIDEADAQPGDLVCFGEPGRTHHIAFWLGDGRILHATGRDGVNAVVEELLENVGARPVRFARLEEMLCISVAEGEERVASVSLDDLPNGQRSRREL